MAFEGVRSLGAAIGERPRQDELVAQAEQARLVAMQTRRARMDKTIADAVMSGRKNDFQEQLAAALDMSDVNNLGVMADRSTQMKAAEQTRGITDQNAARRMALEAIQSGQPLETDMQNAVLAIAGDKILTPNNVQVQDQAGADLAAAQALANQRNTSANFNTARATNVGAGGGAGKIVRMPAQRFMTILGNKYGDQAPNVAQDFMQFQEVARATDPKYNDEQTAFAEYMRSYPQGDFVASQAANSIMPVAGAAPPSDTPVFEGRDGRSKETAYDENDFPPDVRPPSGTIIKIGDNYMVLP